MRRVGVQCNQFFGAVSVLVVGCRGGCKRHLQVDKVGVGRVQFAVDWVFGNGPVQRAVNDDVAADDDREGHGDGRESGVILVVFPVAFTVNCMFRNNAFF